MSYNTLVVQQQDQTLMSRVTACAQQEAWDNPAAGTSPFGQAIRNAQVDPVQVLGWPVCVATEQQYASALAGNVPNPGGDQSVISDGDILSAVQMAWPPQWPPIASTAILAPTGAPSLAGVAATERAPFAPITPALDVPPSAPS